MNKQLAHSFTARLGMAGALASAMLFAVPALAQDSRLSLADRVARLEQQAQHQDQGGIGMVNQMQQLQSQVQQLQGQVEVLQHQLQQAEEKSKAQYIDIDSRLGRIEGADAAGQAGTASAPGATPAGAGGSAAGAVAARPGTNAQAAGHADQPSGNATDAARSAMPADTAGEQAAYDTAFKSLRDGNYAQASRGFRGFIQQYPDSTLAPNAWYWLGESYYVTTNYKVALEAFQRLLQQFPQSDKAADALLKVGYSQLELDQGDAGQASLREVIKKYPGSSAASLAKERLRRLQSPTAAL